MRVYDPAIEPLQLIDRILCMMGQTGARELVNEGSYNAQIDSRSCQQGGDSSTSSSDTGHSSGALAEELEIWVVDSTRGRWRRAPERSHLGPPIRRR